MMLKKNCSKCVYSERRQTKRYCHKYNLYIDYDSSCYLDTNDLDDEEYENLDTTIWEQQE